MATQDQIEIVPLQTIVRKPSVSAEEEIHAPGPKARPFRIGRKEGERLIRLGAARLAEREEDASPEPKPNATRAELEAEAEALGIDLGAIKGTGARGAVKSVDIEEAIATRHAEIAAGGADNPSVVS